MSVKAARMSWSELWLEGMPDFSGTQEAMVCNIVNTATALPGEGFGNITGDDILKPDDAATGHRSGVGNYAQRRAPTR